MTDLILRPVMQPTTFRARIAHRILSWMGYEGATMRRDVDMDALRAASRPDNELIASSIDVLRARSKHLCRNNWAAKRAKTVLTAKVVGSGIVPSCTTDDALNKLVQDWAKGQVGSRRGQTLSAVQRLLFDTVFTQGSALMVRRPRTYKDMAKRGLVVPFDIEIYGSDWLDSDREDGGIEMDESGWVIAYHIREPNRYGAKVVRIPAEHASFGFLQDSPDQVQGVPWLTPVMQKLRDFDQLDDAELMRAKVASMFVAFVTSPPTMGPQSCDPLVLEPGRIQELAAGEDIKMNTPPSHTGYDQFARAQLRAIAAALGVSYEDISNDYSQVNFSSARMGALTTNRLVDTWRESLFLAGFNRDLERWFIDAAELNGYGRAQLTWTAPAHPLVDPSKDLAATEKELELGLTSLSEEIRRRGRNPDDVHAQRMADSINYERGL